MSTETIERTGATLARQMSVMRARCVARYQMHSVPGRPEELEANLRTRPVAGNQPGTPRVISFNYASGSIRIRKHGGERNRTWVDTVDIQVTDGWLDRVYEFLDEWMGYASRTVNLDITATPHTR